MWIPWQAKRRARAAAARASEREALRAEVTARVLAELLPRLSLEKVDAAGHPNIHRLNETVRAIDLVHLNIKSMGYDLARTLAAALPPPASAGPVAVDLGCKPSTQADMEADWTAHWCAVMGSPRVYSRKLWEYCYVMQALHEADLLRPGVRGVGFGCGREPMASLFAMRGLDVVITDQAADNAAARGWAITGQHVAAPEDAHQVHIVDRATFDAHVRFRPVDMNDLPDDLRGYDFCWSICALEHLGSIAAGLHFIERSLLSLRPGGLAVHTTEYNLRDDGPTVDDWPTVLFQRRHFEALAERLRMQGHWVAPLNFDAGDGPMDRFVDLPPWGADLPDDYARWHGQGVHLKVAVDGFPVTCFGLIVRRGN